MQKLRKCPFCGGDRLVIEDSRVAGIEHGQGYVVLCDFREGGCGATGGLRRTEPEAVEVWNLRNRKWNGGVKT